MIHFGAIGLMGLPNVGKSSFLNTILEQKVTIVSQRPQTTRQSLSGVLTHEDYQLVFWDAPGFVVGEDGMFEYLGKEFDQVLDKCDHFFLMIAFDQKESKKWNTIFEKVRKSKKPFSFIFTKSDLPPSEFVMGLKENILFSEDPISSLDFSIHKYKKEETFDFFKNLTRDFYTLDQPLYDPDMISLDRTRDIVSEFIREECFIRLDKEIPFSMAVMIRSFKKEKGLQRIEADIIVEKENHRGIVIGKGGQLLRQIGESSRKKIEELLGEKIFLGLHVTHKKNWMKNKRMMKDLGYHHD